MLFTDIKVNIFKELSYLNTYIFLSEILKQSCFIDIAGIYRTKIRVWRTQKKLFNRLKTIINAGYIVIVFAH